MPVPIGRFVQELEKLKQEVDAGSLKHGEYDQRLARVLGELRDEKLDADRPKVSAALAELLKRGVITPGVKTHIEKRLGL
ncbi:MAG TPA: hypothetical protein VEV39_11400 [Gemmatimonadales bacterium]|nr:hypothetical protein [Gemmatimonadales bacterium]